MIGKILGHYRVDKRLGRGDMSEISRLEVIGFL